MQNQIFNRTNTSTPLGILVLSLALSGLPALAQTDITGKLSVRGGVTQISPKVQSGDLSAPSFTGTKSDIKSATQLSGGINYKLDSNWSIDVPLALPFEHEIVGAGAIANAGKIATTKSLPFTVLGQYNMVIADSRFHPYVGAGLVYGKYFNTKTTSALTALTGGSPSTPTTMQLDSRFGTALQIGTQIDIDKNYFVDVSFIKSFIKTKATLSTNQTMDVTLNPAVFSLGLGYRF